MDERLKIIFARRSVRQYTPEPVSPADLQGLLEAGMAAPSGSNRRPWHFVVVTGRDTLVALARSQPYGKMLAHAPLAIAVCGDPSITRWWVQDCTAATENVLIAAAGLNLGAVWLGVHNDDDREQAIRDILGIPREIGVLSLISIGHPAEHPQPRTQFDPARVHAGKW